MQIVPVVYIPVDPPGHSRVAYWLVTLSTLKTLHVFLIGHYESIVWITHCWLVNFRTHWDDSEEDLMNDLCCMYLISSATSWRSLSVLVLRPCRFLLTEYNWARPWVLYNHQACPGAHWASPKQPDPLLSTSKTREQRSQQLTSIKMHHASPI